MSNPAARGMTIVEQGSTGAIKSCPERYDLVHGDIDDPLVNCCAGGLYFVANFTQGIGSLPGITTPVGGGGFLGLFGYDGIPWGAQFDVKVTNPYDFSIIPYIFLVRPNGLGRLEPGARVGVGGNSVLASAVNGAPPVIGPPGHPSGAFHGEFLLLSNGGAATETINPGNQNVESGFIPFGATPIPPGDFIWLSTLSTIQTIGPWTGTGLWFTVLGVGVTLKVFGIKFP